MFEILGITSGRNEFSRNVWPTKKYINPVQHNTDGSICNGSKINTFASVITESLEGVYYTAKNSDYKLRGCYTRILIKKQTTCKLQKSTTCNLARGF